MTKSRPSLRVLLTEHYTRYGHPFAIGFDPSTSQLSGFLATQLHADTKEKFLLDWYHGVVDVVGRSCGVIKIQSAFFEAAGLSGQAALRKIVTDAKQRGLYVLLDAKRGDIASTMHAYGQSVFDDIGADAVTILPWMGLDVISALLPWMKQGSGVYTVWLSSNQSGRDLQTLRGAGDKTFAESMFQAWEAWAAKEHVGDCSGYVLGATDVPDWSLGVLRERRHSLLMPGIGAQGGQLTRSLKDLIEDHPASILPISRGILSPTIDENINSWRDYSDGVERRWNRYLELWNLL